MRWLLGIVAVAVVLWCGWWFAGARLIEREANAWFNGGAAAQGITASTGSLDVAGLPNRWDVTATEVSLADPAAGWAIRAPVARLYAMTWKPWHLILWAGERQEIALSGREITLTGKDIMASVRARPDMDLPLAEARLGGNGLRISSDDIAFDITDLMAAVRAATDAGDQQDVSLEVKGIAPDPALIAALNAASAPGLPSPNLPPVIERLHLDARVTLSAPLDRHVTGADPRPIALELRSGGFIWGDLALAATGRIAPDATGRAEGRIELAVTNWDRLPAILVGAGLVEPRALTFATGFLRAIAADGGDPKVLRVPLVLKDGQMNFGPIPLGPAPQLIPATGG